MIDTHAHLYDKQFDSDRVEVIERAIEKGISKIVMPNVDSKSVEPMLEIATQFSRWCYPAVGLHPCYVQKDFEKELYRIEEYLSKESFIAIGEIGLDLYWDKSFFEYQQEALRIQIQWAKRLNLPIIVHCRACIEEIIKFLEKEQDGTLRGVLHCFSGTLQQAQKIISTGFYIGIGGIVTFPKGGLEQVLPFIETDNILLETDAPYLAPIPHRGKRNEPSYLSFIIEKIARLQNKTVEEIEISTDKNAQDLFGPTSSTQSQNNSTSTLSFPQ
ncbi:MAG: TatD family hydrolase [Cytophagales bacterium]|nr:TatD family hydrolase [Cytophagales bacterium]MDW8385292.1 TatD family hydrolase [Flammeovirgaceae bacterium]